MPTFQFVLLYVADPLASARFYSRLFDRPLKEESPSFAMLELGDNVLLGLWLRPSVEPAVEASAGAGSSEIAFVVSDGATLSATFETWTAQGVRIAQPITEMDFGRTFVGLDPDGHRLRVFLRRQPD